MREDESGKWRRKVGHYVPLIMSGDLTYKPDMRFDQLVAVLFPELVDQLGRYPRKESNNPGVELF